MGGHVAQGPDAGFNWGGKRRPHATRSSRRNVIVDLTTAPIRGVYHPAGAGMVWKPPIDIGHADPARKIIGGDVPVCCALDVLDPEAIKIRRNNKNSETTCVGVQ